MVIISDVDPDPQNLMNPVPENKITKYISKHLLKVKK